MQRVESWDSEGYAVFYFLGPVICKLLGWSKSSFGFLYKMFGEIPNEFFGQLNRWRMEFFVQNPGVVAWGKFNKRPLTKMWSGFGENNNYGSVLWQS